MLESATPPAIPLWINGHAFLTLTPAFHDVINSRDGTILRRTPMCGAVEAAIAVESARLGQQEWGASEHRTQLLSLLGDELLKYAAHFSQLISEESGLDISATDDEIATSASLLHTAETGDTCQTVGIVGNKSHPLLSALRLACPVLKAGGTVIFLPPPEAPSALFALAELSGRCGFPAGVINVIHGDNAALEGLRATLSNPLLHS